MIVISQNFVLEPTGDINANNPLVGWHNIVTAGTIVADGAADGYPAANLANPVTAQRWVAADDSEQYLTITTGTEEDIDYIGVAGHNFGSAAIPVSIEGWDDMEEEWFELVEAALLPAADDPVIFQFEPQPLSQIRIKLQSGDDVPAAAVVYCGKLLTLLRRIYVGHTPATMGRTLNVANGRSESGNFMGRIVIGEGRSTTIVQANLPPAWYRANMEPFVRAAETQPFFFAWRPQTYPAETGFLWLTSDPRPVNDRANGFMRIELAVEGIA